MMRIVVSLSAVAMLGACSVGRATPTDTVQEAMRKLDTGECVGLRDYFVEAKGEPRQFSPLPTGAQLEQSCTREIEARKKAPPGDKRRLKQVNILDQREDGDRATVRFELEMESGDKEGPGAVALVREDNRWRIDLAATSTLNRPSPAEMGPAQMGPPDMGPEGPMGSPPSMEPPPASPPTLPDPK